MMSPMQFRQIADDVWHASVYPFNSVNVYLADGILFDAGVRGTTAKLLQALQPHSVGLHALTHVHPDHQGASRTVCERFGVELWCGAADADVMEQGDLVERMGVRNPLLKLLQRRWMGPPHPVARRLQAGDTVGSFEVIDVPGHSPGHVAYWRARDGVLILGDVLNHMNLLTGLPGLHEPPRMFTPDPAENRRSARKLAALKPNLLCFGHGPILRDTARFTAFVSALA